MPQRDQIPAGTDVGLGCDRDDDVDGSFAPAQWFVADDGHEHMVDLSDPHISIVIVEPERPTTADIIGDHALRNMVERVSPQDLTLDVYAARCRCGNTTSAGSIEAALRWHAEHVAAALAEAGLSR